MTFKSCAYAAALTLGVAQAATAGGPVRLTAPELDQLTAGQVDAELGQLVTIFPDGTMVPGTGPGGPFGEMPGPDGTPQPVTGDPVSDASLSSGLFVLLGPGGVILGPFGLLPGVPLAPGPLNPGLAGVPIFFGASSDDMSMSAASSSNSNP